MNKEPIFKTQKSNLPKNNKVLNELNTFINSVKAEIINPKNRLKVSCNQLGEEIAALRDLVKLEREKKIVMKQCNRGAGIMIIDYKDFRKAATEHPEEKMEDKDGHPKPYYKKVDNSIFKAAKNKLTQIWQSGYDNEIITKPEFEAM